MLSLIHTAVYGPTSVDLVSCMSHHDTVFTYIRLSSMKCWIERVLSVQAHSRVHHLTSPDHSASTVPDQTLYTMFSPARRKKSPCWVRPRVKAGAAPRVPFHCSWLRILLPRSGHECSRLGFLRDIMFYCMDAISGSPCLAAMQRGNKCLHFPPRGRLVRRS